MCRLMGRHFHYWIDYDGVAFSIELLVWGGIFSDFLGYIYDQQRYQNVCTEDEKYSVLHSI